MPPRLIKVSIAKDTLAPRHFVRPYLFAIDRLGAMPAPRCTTDALRAGRSYLRQYAPPAGMGALGTSADHMAFGRAHLFDLDLRRLAYTLLADDAEPLWPGVLVALTPVAALEHVRKLGTLLHAGALTCEVLLLSWAPHNCVVLGEALSQHYGEALKSLMGKMQSRRVHLPEIEGSYRSLCLRMGRAAELLGVPLACRSEQMACEAALARVSHTGGLVET